MLPGMMDVCSIKRMAMKPNAELYNPDPEYLRTLIEQGGYSLSETARLIGMSRNGLRNYLRKPSEHLSRRADYRVQFALECLAQQEIS